MKITKDGFIWKVVTDKAEQILENNLFPLFILNTDGSETHINYFNDLYRAKENGLNIVIEVGRVETNDAKEILANNGYYTDNLWTVHDVMDKFNCNKKQAYNVLDSALRNEATVEQIQFAISDKCLSEGYLVKE